MQLNLTCGRLLRSLGTCAELLLLHFSSFVLGRCLEVTVRCEEENLLLPCVPYCPDNAQQLPQEGSHVITVSAPKIAPRYHQNTYYTASHSALVSHLKHDIS